MGRESFKAGFASAKLCMRAVGVVMQGKAVRGGVAGALVTGSM